MIVSRSRGPRRPVGAKSYSLMSVGLPKTSYDVIVAAWVRSSSRVVVVWVSRGIPRVSLAQVRFVVLWMFVVGQVGHCCPRPPTTSWVARPAAETFMVSVVPAGFVTLDDVTAPLVSRVTL